MEAVYLFCGAGGPQLKRNPLGGPPPKDTQVKQAFIGSLALALAIGCSALQDLRSLQAGLQRQFHLPPPGIDLRNNTVLVIGIEDTVVIGADSLSRAQVVDSIARFVRDSFAAFGKLSALTIGLTRLSHSGSIVVRTPYFIKSFHIPDLTEIPLVIQ